MLQSSLTSQTEINCCQSLDTSEQFLYKFCVGQRDCAKGAENKVLSVDFLLRKVTSCRGFGCGTAIPSTISQQFFLCCPFAIIGIAGLPILTQEEHFAQTKKIKSCQ